MRRPTDLLMIPALGALLAIGGAGLLQAQITNQIQAHVNHPFIVGNATLPPGTYTFRMLPGSDLTVMTAMNDKNDTGAEFLVRESVDPTRPQHSELFFNRYGNKEFLTKIYEAGSKVGVAVVEPSREELRLQKQGQHPVEHMEQESD